MHCRQLLAFLSYRYVPQIFVFVKFLENVCANFETPNATILVEFVRGNFLKFLGKKILDSSAKVLHTTMTVLTERLI
jgi:hypothetical protein